MPLMKFSPLHNPFSEGGGFPGAEWGDACEMPVPVHIGESAQEIEFSQALTLADASFLPRIVIKGPQAALFLQSQNIPIPESILKVAALKNGGLIARTGGSEFFLESGPTDGTGVPSYESIVGPGVYPVLRQDASLIISGSRAGELFRHVSSYDFLTNPHHDLVFTPIAGVSCSVLRTELNGIPVFRLWTDGTYGLYIWHTLLEVATELGGGAVGTAVFFPGLSQREANR